LRDKKILVLDEASSSLDVATDAVIQATLRRAFAGCTIIAIAHRLNTLIDFDQVIVLSRGQVIETGNPRELMQKPNGPFSSLLRGSDEALKEDVPDESGIIIAEL
jgi:ABC-type multidrug transport system fused ATPase/permease subunit